MVNVLLLLFAVFNSNFIVFTVLSQFSLKTGKYCSSLFQSIFIRNSSFLENANTKVYALEESLGVDLLKFIKFISPIVPIFPNK